MITAINSNLPTFGNKKNQAKPVVNRLSFRSELKSDIFVRNNKLTFKGDKEVEQARQTIKYYDDNAAEYCQSTVNVQGMDHDYNEFLSLLPSCGKILDAGCGSGRDAKRFLDKGYDVTAIDASEKIAAEASRFIGRKVLPIRFDQLEFKNQFDGIWACASLLHVPKSEIDESITHLIESLKPGGVLFISVKNGEGESVDNKGRFFNYFSQQDLDNILKKHPNLDLIKQWDDQDNLNRKTTTWMSILLRKKS